MMPSRDQIGVPIHFHSSTTSGSASLMSLRILLRVSPRQSPSSAILFEMSSDADWPWLVPDFFMFLSYVLDRNPLRFDHPHFVFPGLGPGIHERLLVDGRAKPGQDGVRVIQPDRTLL